MWTKEINVINAKGTAYEITKQFGISKPEDIVLEDIAMARGVLVIEGHLDGAEARLIRRGNKGIIRVSDNIPEIGRKRFAIAHDLGHWEMHKDISQLELYTESETGSYSSSNPYEVEASIFASELLMPSKLFRPRCEDLFPNLKVISSLATEFETTLTSAALRFVEESNQSCAVVFSKDGKVLWWKKSDCCEEIWIERKQKLHSESLAWGCFKEETVSEEGERVPAYAWLQSQKGDEIDEIFEQSMKLGHYSTVLSLLWID